METNKRDLKVFAILIEISDALFLSVQYAESLEQALAQSRIEFIKLNPSLQETSSELNFKVGLYSIKKVVDLVEEHKEHLIPKENSKSQIKFKKLIPKKNELKKAEPKKVKIDPIEIKNIIMKQIIETRDKALLNKHKDLFTVNDISYIESKLKEKK